MRLSNQKAILTILLYLLTIEALFAGMVFSSRPIGLGLALKSGYIALDLIFLFVCVLMILGAGSLIFLPKLKERVSAGLETILQKGNWLPGLVILTGLISFEFFQDYLILISGMPSVYYYEARKLLLNKFPGFLLIFLASFQFLLYLIITKRDQVSGWISEMIRGRKAIYFLGIVLAFILVNISGVGFTSRETDLAAAQTLNAPLLGIQVTLIAVSFISAKWIYGMIIRKWPRLKTILSTEYTAVFVIWILTVFFWSSSPIGPNYFIDIPRAPNFGLYPSSDALKYDIQALDLFNGGGMRPNSLQNNVDFIYHPAHSFFLGVLHLISGNSYQSIIFPQIVILSLIPVLLYKLGSLIHSRFSGLVISVLFLVRERNAIFLGERITVSNVKTLMTEPWALLFFLLFLFLLLSWVRSGERKSWLLISAGGVFGILVLIRMEVLAMIPVIGLLGLIYYWRKPKIWFRSALLAGISIMLIITPWMIRNYQVEGVFGLDKSYYVRWNINRYLDYLIPDQKENEDGFELDESGSLDTSWVAKNAMGITNTQSGEGKFDYQFEDDISYLFDDFFNSITQTVYYLPNNHQPLLGLGNPGLISLKPDLSHRDYLEQYVDSLPYWQYDWDGKLATRSYLPLVFSLGIMSYGLALIKKGRMWIPILLLALILTQAAVYAVLSGSGGRYIAIVDWIPLVFFGIGLSGLITKGALLIDVADIDILGAGSSVKTDSFNQSIKVRKNMIGIIWVLLAGLIFPLSEILIPARYSEMALSAQNDLFKDRYGIEIPGSTRKKDVILFGQALYPRFFEAGDRMEDDRRGTIPDYSYQRVEFYFVGTQNGWVTLPLAEGIDYFPHGSEVIILAEKAKREISPDGRKVHGRYFKAKTIYLLNPGQVGISPKLLNCSGEECVLMDEE